MARLLSFTKLVSTSIVGSATVHTAIAKITAPTNQKLVVRFFVNGEGTSTTGPHNRFTVRRNANGNAESGATIAALTPVKRDTTDGETLQASVKNYTVQPTSALEADGGDIVDQFEAHPQGSAVSQPYIVHGGKAITLYGICANGTTNAVTVGIEVEE